MSNRSALEGTGRRRKRTLVQALAVQGRIIGALMIREVSTRYGHENIGFFWLMGEPLLLTVGVMLMWTMTGLTHGHDIGIVPFALTGYSILTLWRHIVSQSVHSMRRNIGLLFHRNVRFFDVVFANTLLEVVGCLAAFFIAYVPLMLLGFLDPMHDPLAMIGGWLLMAWFSFGFGLVLAGVTELNEGAERFVNPIMYITLPATGSFSMQEWLPQKLRDVLSWSPLVNANEMFRYGLFGRDIKTYWSAGYLASCAIVLTAIGMLLVQKAQRHVKME